MNSSFISDQKQINNSSFCLEDASDFNFEGTNLDSSFLNEQQQDFVENGIQNQSPLNNNTIPNHITITDTEQYSSLKKQDSFQNFQESNDIDFDFLQVQEPQQNEMTQKQIQNEKQTQKEDLNLNFQLQQKISQHDCSFDFDTIHEEKVYIPQQIQTQLNQRQQQNDNLTNQFSNQTQNSFQINDQNQSEILYSINQVQQQQYYTQNNQQNLKNLEHSNNINQNYNKISNQNYNNHYKNYHIQAEEQCNNEKLAQKYFKKLTTNYYEESSKSHDNLTRETSCTYSNSDPHFFHNNSSSNNNSSTISQQSHKQFAINHILQQQKKQEEDKQYQYQQEHYQQNNQQKQNQSNLSYFQQQQQLNEAQKPKKNGKNQIDRLKRNYIWFIYYNYSRDLQKDPNFKNSFKNQQDYFNLTKELENVEKLTSHKSLQKICQKLLKEQKTEIAEFLIHSLYYFANQEKFLKKKIKESKRVTAENKPVYLELIPKFNEEIQQVYENIFCQ
ncbi:hypothetical protein PPERSA_05267 [Pseudocohnilembus persalinus]|uniref:Uncharacterized protein n=1 Tax=Pseudocohnilembus persalinus TaxID=266149 RepID=A0A0V0QXP1_PSEPJ|nr:hypothetical protein PPERSA_05267 [Pseudocohnilembus persalinus]|eukprot:KRX07103.1 hypothetical protein PPERSA_05267 [Pseudocohnilembus persalinus]